MADGCCTCETIREIVKEEVEKLFIERLAKLTTEVKTKKTRSPSKYNVYMGSCVKEGGDFRSCAVKWKKCKAEGTEPCPT